MQDFIFIFFSLAVVITLIYVIYRAMLGTEKSTSKDELQITAPDLLEQVNILYKQKKFVIAENLAKKYLEKKFANDELRTLLTKCLHDGGKIYESIEQAKIVIRNQPKNHSMKVFLASCYLEVMQPMSAIGLLKEVLNDDPDNVAAMKELAKIYFDTNQKRSAIKMYERLEEFIYSNQEKVKNKNLLAQMHIGFEEFDLAIQEYKEILEIYPDDVDVKKKLIGTYKKNNEYDLAIESIIDLLELHTSDINDLWALTTLSDAYLKLQDYEKALEYAKLVKDHSLSNKTTASDNIAKILLCTGQIDESIKILSELAAQNDGDIEIKKSLAKSYEAKQDFEAVMSIYKKILDVVGAHEVKQVHSEMSDIFSNWAMYLFEKQNNLDCFKKFSLAIQYDSQNPKVYYRLGMVNQSIKNFNEAISQYKKAIELDNENSVYYYVIAECYAEIDNVFEEKKALLECFKYNPTNAKVCYKLALLYESQHDIMNAMISIRKAIELDDDYTDAKYRLAIMLEHQGNKDEAIEMYEQIVRIAPENEEAQTNLKMLKAQV